MAETCKPLSTLNRNILGVPLYDPFDIVEQVESCQKLLQAVLLSIEGLWL
jgi:hypothetical protein